MSIRYKIGYIDEDPNQVKLYKRKLRVYGFEVIGYEFHKGMTIEELMEQVYSSNIDLLMIDFRLNESNVIPFNGDVVERYVYENKPLFPHIIFTNKVDQAEPDVDDLKLIFDKEIVFPEDEGNNLRTHHFIEVLTKSIEQYKTYINGKKEKISELLDKEEAGGLNAKEKNDLLSLQNELLCLDKMSISEVPESLKSFETLEKISQARKDAEAYIQSLIEKIDDESKR